MMQDLFSSVEENLNPFHNRRVVIGGEFTLSQKALRNKLRAMGATIDTNVTRNTHYVILGSFVPQTLLDNLYNVRVRRGFNVRELHEADVMNIFNGFCSEYYTYAEVTKDLHLTLEHFESAEIRPVEGENPVLEENIYVPSDIKQNRPLLYQIIGNIGAYANDEIVNESEADKTKPIVMLTEATIQCLREGKEDDVIRYIQKTYNESNSDGVAYEFISETSLLQWIRQRCEACGDTMTLSALERYIRK